MGQGGDDEELAMPYGAGRQDEACSDLLLLDLELRHGVRRGLTNQGDPGRDRPDGCHGLNLASYHQAEHEGQDTLCENCADGNGQEEDESENDSAHTVSIGVAAPKSRAVMTPG